jgi:hypothetical protein
MTELVLFVILGISLVSTTMKVVDNVLHAVKEQDGWKKYYTE